MAQDTNIRAGSTDYVTFRVSDMLCGLNILGVQEIKRVHQITAVYHAPPYVRGVVNMRGRVVTVIDVRYKLGFEVLSRSPALVIIVPHGEELLGLLVDDVDDIVRAEPGNVVPAPPNLNGIEKELFSAVLKLEQSLVAILDCKYIAQRRSGPRNTT